MVFLVGISFGGGGFLGFISYFLICRLGVLVRFRGFVLEF